AASVRPRKRREFPRAAALVRGDREVPPRRHRRPRTPPGFPLTRKSRESFAQASVGLASEQGQSLHEQSAPTCPASGIQTGDKQMSTAVANRPMTAEEKKVIFASSLGTVFEWYDFYLYGSLAAIIAKQFFSGLDAGSAFIFALLAFAAGFIVRPFGAIFFGRLGDMIGRKYTFLV